MLSNHLKFNKSLQSFAEFFCTNNNRFKFLYEVDVQVELSKFLEKEFSEKHIIKKEIQSDESIQDIVEFDIGKVHREYPKYGKTNKERIPFDNVILGEPKQWDEIPDISNENYESFYHQPVMYAIELKFIALNQSGVLNADKSLDDYSRMIKKIDSLIFKEDLEYSIQLTLFQSKKQMVEFLKNHDRTKRLKFDKWLNDKYSENQENKMKSGYYYVDIEDGCLKEVWN